MNMIKTAGFMLIFLVILFIGIASIPSGEEKPQDFCNTILTFDGDIDNICAERFENEIRKVCNTHEPNISEDTCLSEVTLLLIDDCIATEERLGIDKNVCIYKKMKNFSDDLERWLK